METDEKQKTIMLLKRWKDGDDDALDQVVALCYQDLRRQARALLRKERPNHTLASCGLINEVFIHLRKDKPFTIRDREHFLALMNRCFRRSLADYAIRRNAQKRGGKYLVFDHKIDINDVPDLVDRSGDIAEAWEEMATVCPEDEYLFNLKYVCGFSYEEMQQQLDLNYSRVSRGLKRARDVFQQQLREKGIFIG